MLTALALLVFEVIGNPLFLQLNNQLLEFEFVEENSKSSSFLEKDSENISFLQQSSLPTLVVVSDASNQVSGPCLIGTANAIVTSQGNSQLNGASWIWDTTVPNNLGLQRIIYITKTFTIAGIPSKGSLILYVNGIFTLTVNNQVTTCQTASVGNNTVNCDISSYLVYGLNTLVFTVVNQQCPASTTQQNPNGLLYQLTVSYSPLSTLIIVSDTSNKVSGPCVNGINNAVVTFQGTSQIPGASWIWNTVAPNNLGLQSIVIITKTFNISGLPSKGLLTLYVNGQFTLSVNNLTTNCQTASVNSSTVNCDISSYLLYGANVIVFTVINQQCPAAGSSNPNGLLYQLSIGYTPGIGLIIVSDTTNQVSGPDVVGVVNAVVSSYEGISPIPGALWIWDAAVVSNPQVQQTVIVTKTFIINGILSKANLVAYVDNQFTLNVNGKLTNCQAANISANPVSCDIANYLVSGSNTLSFTVINEACSGNNAQQNPAGLVYQLTIFYNPFPIINLIIVSDVSNQVSGPDVTGTVGAVVSIYEPVSTLSGASWIWDASVVSNPLVQQSIIITKDFVIVGKPLNASLIVYADDTFTLKVNCQVSNCQASTIGANPVICNVLSLLTTGNNHIEFGVTNNGVPGSNAKQNSAGLLYQLSITSQQNFLN